MLMGWEDQWQNFIVCGSPKRKKDHHALLTHQSVLVCQQRGRKTIDLKKRKGLHIYLGNKYQHQQTIVFIQCQSRF